MRRASRGVSTDSAPVHYEPIAVSAESTVVAEFVPDPAGVEAYQSEAALEAEFIRLLEGQAYEYLTIRSEADLVANLRRQLELERIIEEEGLKPDETRAFMDMAFRDGAIRSTGTAITRVLPPVSRFAPDGAHGEQKQRILAKLSDYFERFFGLGSG